MNRVFGGGSLYHNGADEPGRWQPMHANGRQIPMPAEGDLVAWRYGGWRVVEVRKRDRSVLNEEDAARIDAASAGRTPEGAERAREAAWPYAVVLRHESGPMLLPEGFHPKRLHDGSITVHVGVRRGTLFVVSEPFMACSCHGHIWPCQEIDQAEMAAHNVAKMTKLLATAEPGVCAACLQPISTRQRTLTFPEESRMVPGAPGPTFHAGRANCWAAAEKYEREGRLADNPDVERLASCPGVRFIHESLDLFGPNRLECTAGLLCTGHHGPAGYRHDIPCTRRLHLASGPAAAPVRPPTDCGYRSGNLCCAGGLVDGSSVSDAIAADLMWANRSSGWSIDG